MVMEKNRFMNHLKASEGGQHWECEFCGHSFGFSVTPKTFITHLAGAGGPRSKICASVPLNVKNEAAQALRETEEGARKRCRIMPVPSNGVRKEDVESEGSRVGDNWMMEPFPCWPYSADFMELNKKMTVFLDYDGTLSPIIGIYSEEEQRRTTFMTGVYSEILEERNFFDYQREREWSYDDYQRRKAWSFTNQHVYWMNVSRDHKVYEWQNLFAKRIGLDLSQYADERQRAVKLSEAMSKKGRCIFFLDNLRKAFDVDQVGIPETCKLIFTTRTRNVCERMGCRPEHMIHV